ncbi:unnamed protein product [Jaminaea pallidilutea]
MLARSLAARKLKASATSAPLVSRCLDALQAPCAWSGSSNAIHGKDVRVPSQPQQPQHRRNYRSYVRVRAPGGSGSARVPLGSSVYGQSISRGTRPYQEDAFSVSCLEIPPKELRASLKRGGRISTEAEKRWKWDSQDDELDTELAGQVNWFGVFDGHGGDYASKYLSKYLHQIFESVQPDMVTDTVQFTREHGGYFRRFTGGELAKWTRQEELKPVRGGRAGKQPGSNKTPNAEHMEQVSTSQSSGPTANASTSGGSSGPPISAAAASKRSTVVPQWDDAGLTQRVSPPDDVKDQSLTMSERATLAFLVADRHILMRHPQPNEKEASQGGMTDRRGIQTRESIAKREQQEKGPEAKGQVQEGMGGSTASVLTLHSIDSPPTIWYDSKFLQLGAWHLGDTRMLLCPTADGKCIPLTTHHHPDTLSESERLRRLGAGVVTDSFGEARWMGALANTRALGDGEFKAAGVTSEPELLSQVIRSDNYSHVTLFSDGISSMMSDQEVVDLARGCKHPQEAAKKILDFAEELGVADNATVLVVPLKGWGKIGGQDSTLKQREYRKSKTDVFRDNRQ